MYNKVIDTLSDAGVGFLPSQVDGIGKTIAKTLQSALWLLDPHRDKFRSRAIPLPFEDFQGYNDYKAQKKMKPMLRAKELKENIDSLCEVLNHPWFANPKFSQFQAEVVKLVHGMKRYHDILIQQQERTASNHASPAPVRSLKDNWTLKNIVANPSGQIKQEYEELVKVFQDSMYEPISLLDYEPTDRYDRRMWLDNLSLPFAVTVYSYQHGNYMGNIHFIWQGEPIEQKTVEIVASLKEKIPVYSTRAMRRDFFDTYKKCSQTKPAVLRSMFRYLRDDASAPETTSEGEVDYRLEECLLATDDEELVYDLRKNNGRVQDPRFEPFWDELKRFLEEKAAVHERRHGDHLYLPFAISVESLQREIQSRLLADTPVPSASWIRLNFWPSNPYTRTAMSYTGRFKVKYAVQQRLVRGQHDDSPFTAFQFKMMKEMATMFKEHSVMICVDDKAVVPIGEPEAAMSTGVRPHNRSLVPVGSTLVASDHDFHVSGAVPSVLFTVDIPEDARDSFYRGEIHVTLKDKVFQASTPMRHAAETVEILRQCHSENDVDIPQSILFVYSDTGPITSRYSSLH